MKVFLNPGHKVGLDSGAVNPTNGKTEAETVLKIGGLVADYLATAGIDCELLQSNSLAGEDEDRNNPSICRTANESGADIFVSLHCNAANGRAQGTETLVYSEGGSATGLANAIQKRIVESLDMVDRGIKSRPDLAVLRHTTMPAVLVELAFIDNDEDCQKLIKNEYEFARAVAAGIADYAGADADQLATAGQDEKGEDADMIIYKTIYDVPEWGRETVNKLIAKKVLGGTGNGEINISNDMLRTLVILDRLGKLD